MMSRVRINRCGSTRPMAARVRIHSSWIASVQRGLTMPSTPSWMSRFRRWKGYRTFASYSTTGGGLPASLQAMRHQRVRVVAEVFQGRAHRLLALLQGEHIRQAKPAMGTDVAE